MPLPTHVRNGGFEEIPEGLENGYFAEGPNTIASWSIGERVWIDGVDSDFANDGTVFLLCDGVRPFRFTFEQADINVSDIPSPALSYAYNVFYAPADDPCTLTVSFAGAVVDTFQLLDDVSEVWIERTIPFVPASVSGDLEFVMDCIATPGSQYVSVFFDDISIEKAVT